MSSRKARLEEAQQRIRAIQGRLRQMMKEEPTEDWKSENYQLHLEQSLLRRESTRLRQAIKKEREANRKEREFIRREREARTERTVTQPQLEQGPRQQERHYAQQAWSYGPRQQEQVRRGNETADVVVDFLLGLWPPAIFIAVLAVLAVAGAVTVELALEIGVGVVIWWILANSVLGTIACRALGRHLPFKRTEVGMYGRYTEYRCPNCGWR
jgi:hypothetical protein